MFCSSYRHHNRADSHNNSIPVGTDRRIEVSLPNSPPVFCDGFIPCGDHILWQLHDSRRQYGSVHYISDHNSAIIAILPFDLAPQLDDQEKYDHRTAIPAQTPQRVIRLRQHRYLYPNSIHGLRQRLQWLRSVSTLLECGKQWLQAIGRREIWRLNTSNNFDDIDIISILYLNLIIYEFDADIDQPG